MNKNIILIFLAFATLFFSCEKEGDKVTVNTVVAPALVSIPDLTLERANGGETLLFLGSAVDPGFTASALYFLEAGREGTDFASPVLVWSGVNPDTMAITVAGLNQLLLGNGFKGDTTYATEFRLRSVLVVDAGASAPGTGDEPFEYTSDVSSESVTTFGFMRLDLTGASFAQKIISPLSDGIYSGLVKALSDFPFTLVDPETGTSYGDQDGSLVAGGGSGIVPPDVPGGWYILTADINPSVLTYTFEPYFIGIIGSATPTGWDSDTDMDYNAELGKWYITMTMVDGFFKFRRNDGWSWNMGLLEGTTGAMEGPLQQGGVGNDIPITAGTYTFYFTIYNDAEGYYEIVPQP